MAGSGERRHLIVEAGTGTGKTLAYLLPLLSGKRSLFDRDEGAAGAACSSGIFRSSNRCSGSLAGLLHEGPRELPVPPEAIRR